MFLSTTLLQNTYLNLFKNHMIENFQHKRTDIEHQRIMVNNVLFLTAILFFIMELILFYFSIIVSLKCARNRTELIIYFIFSISFTTPFLLFMMLSNKDCINSAFQ